jgi:hypothetical protein
MGRDHPLRRYRYRQIQDSPGLWLHPADLQRSGSAPRSLQEFPVEHYTHSVNSFSAYVPAEFNVHFDTRCAFRHLHGPSYREKWLKDGIIWIVWYIFIIVDPLRTHTVSQEETYGRAREEQGTRSEVLRKLWGRHRCKSCSIPDVWSSPIRRGSHFWSGRLIEAP